VGDAEWAWVSSGIFLWTLFPAIVESSGYKDASRISSGSRCLLQRTPGTNGLAVASAEDPALVSGVVKNMRLGGSQHDDKIECWHFIGGIGGGRRQTPPAEYLAGIACMAQIYLERPAVRGSARRQRVDSCCVEKQVLLGDIR
jgi:hypothetical protein